MGEELGVDQEDYKDVHEYAKEIGKKISEIKTDPNWKDVIKGIEHRLGLDKLGVSLVEVIDSMTSTDSQKKLNEALLAAKDETNTARLRFRSTKPEPIRSASRKVSAASRGLNELVPVLTGRRETLRVIRAKFATERKKGPQLPSRPSLGRDMR